MPKELLLNDIHRVISFAKENEKEFVEMVTALSEKVIIKILRDNHKELAQATERVDNLGGIIKNFMRIIWKGKSRMTVS